MPKKSFKTVGFAQIARPTVKCNKCNGTGKHPLSDEIFSVLMALIRAGRTGFVTAVDLSKTIGKNVHVTAMNNRLEYLREIGLVSRTRVGRVWHYRIV